MKDIIRDRLNKMEDLEQRRMLKDVMTGLFLNLVEYQETLNRQIEERVFNELEPEEVRHDVYASLCPREELDPLHEFLYPMVPGDSEPQFINLAEVAAALSKQEEMKLCTLFLQCDTSQIRSLARSKRQFKGEMITSGGRYEITVRLKQSSVYTERIEELYRIFRKNSLPWKTVHIPYAYKFMDCILISCASEWDNQETVKQISIQLEELEPYKHMNLVPIWNIQRMEMKIGGFPVPAADRVNYEHVLPLRRTGTEHGYLVDGEEANIRYIKRSEEEITVVSPLDKSDSWTMLKVTRPMNSGIGRMHYPLLSNRRQEGYIGRYVRQAGSPVRSKGGIARLTGAFEVSREVELEDVKILPPGQEIPLTYELNSFVSDQVRVQTDKYRMRLLFSAVARDRSLAGSYLSDDVLSFLVSEVQLVFPEYRCEGAWV
ncbi:MULTISPECIES: normocyte-binding protein [unclassified Paenibacillus]|uniref:normocyte-binding protein n=1 Tax=unclassified Paenibacillus TaxID=185978 RepID=UPI0030F6AE6A